MVFATTTGLIAESSNQCAAAWQLIKKDGSLKWVRSAITVAPDDLNSFFIDSVQQTREAVVLPTVSAIELLQRVPSPNCAFVPVAVSEEQVLSVVKRLRNSHSRDVYGMSASFLKQIIGYIVQPLAYCINCCIIDGVFPQSLKLAKVVPVHKKGSHDQPENFRPVSILPVLSKVFESVLKNQLYDYFCSNDLLSAAHYGFRTGLSTVHAVERLMNDVLDSFESRDFVGTTLCDLSKAFDIVEVLFVIGSHSRLGKLNIDL